MKKIILIALIFLAQTVSAQTSPNCGSSGVCRNMIFAEAPGKTLRADIYLPTNKPTTKTPAIIYFFPGSWAAGDKDVCMDGNKPQWFIDNFRKEGYAFICVDYRLTDTAIFPAQIYDAKAAVRWVRASASTYNINPGKIGALGWSAGGHLALMLGATVGEPAFEGNLGNQNQSSAVQAVVSLVGPSYFIPPLSVWTDGSQNAAIYAYLGGDPERDTKAFLSSLNATVAAHINGDEPPMLLQYGNKDSLVPLIHGVTVDKAMKAKGRVSQYKAYDGGHGSFDWYPDQIAFFNKYLKETNNTIVSPQTSVETKVEAKEDVKKEDPKVETPVVTSEQVQANTNDTTVAKAPVTVTTYCKFDAQKYADYYPDLKKAFGYDATKLKQHWLVFGMKEGRTPCGSDMASCRFDPVTYVNFYPDLINAKVDGTLHYIKFGVNENRDVCRKVVVSKAEGETYATILTAWTRFWNFFKFW